MVTTHVAPSVLPVWCRWVHGVQGYACVKSMEDEGTVDIQLE